jgi:hypothetical protein
MEFDDEWIKNYDIHKETSKKIRTLKLVFFYMNSDNVIQKINQEIFQLTNNVLTKDEIIRLILDNRKKHELTSLLSYIVKDIDKNTDYTTFFQEIKIESISFDNTDAIFESTNCLFFIFRESNKKLKSNKTKKIQVFPSRHTRRNRQR